MSDLIINRVLVCLSMAIFFASCSVGCAAKFDPHSVAAYVDISYEDRAKSIKYSGRGAGASAMLMSSMGPMGIAVGLAIDEGIGKDIHTAFERAGYDLSDIVEASAKRQLVAYCLPIDTVKPRSVCDADTALQIYVSKLAFRSAPGNSDDVVPDIEFNLQYRSTLESTVASKQMLMCEEKTAALEVVKKDGAVSAELLSRCFDILIAHGIKANSEAA